MIIAKYGMVKTPMISDKCVIICKGNSREARFQYYAPGTIFIDNEDNRYTLVDISANFHTTNGFTNIVIVYTLKGEKDYITITDNEIGTKYFPL